MTRGGGRIDPLTMRFHEIVRLTRVRFILFIRQPEAVFWTFVFPLLLTIVLGFAFREQELAPSRVGVFDTGASLVAGLDDRSELTLVHVQRSADAQRKLRKGAIDVLIVQGTDGPELRFDPKRPEAALARLRVLEALAPSKQSPRILADRPVTERGSRYIDFLFAGILGMNLMGTGIWGVGFELTDMRQKKLLKRLLVTPMRRSSLFISMLAWRLLFLIPEMGVLLSVGVFFLGVPFKGSVASVFLLCVLGSLCFASVGLLLASRARTIQGVSGLMNAVMMPMWLASGIFFSYERFPEFLHGPLRALPLTALNDALRGLLLDGRGLAHYGVELGVLGLWTVVPMLISLRIFRWQ